MPATEYSPGWTLMIEEVTLFLSASLCSHF